MSYCTANASIDCLRRLDDGLEWLEVVLEGGLRVK
jgi:hypothetical protein